MAVHHAYLPLAEAKPGLRAAVADEVPAAVRGDPLRVRQILTNFVANAIKFTERGSVRIEAGMRGGAIRLAVHDTGPGIAPTRSSACSRPFSQADDSITRRYGGTGLGLSICRELAALMGGSVGVNSAPGYGSAFWADLPLAAATPPAPGRGRCARAAAGRARADRRGQPGQHADRRDPCSSSGPGRDAGERRRQRGRGRRGRGRRRAAFDLVLMDVHMPVMSGHAAVRALRERFDAETLPVIALTAAALTSERDEAMAAGMNDFLTKPIDVARLRETLARYLRRTAAA